jgi:1-acyl-sn-glycerol-3-phosphate acyltransferase
VRVAFDPDSLDARDEALIARLLPSVHAFNRGYLRLRVRGRDNVPSDPALFVSNHNGGIAGPDLPCTLATLWELHPRPLYALAHDFAMRQLTALGSVLQRFGAVRACHENGLRVFEAGGSVLVYPGGDLDAYRHSARRDEIVFGPRTGFIRLARDANVPIVPIVVHGAHRSAFVFDDGAWIARLLGLQRWGRLERFPLALALPWGLAAGPWIPWLPLPFPITIQILPPMRVDEGSLEAARDRVRGAMQKSLDRLAFSGGRR